MSNTPSDSLARHLRTIGLATVKLRASIQVAAEVVAPVVDKLRRKIEETTAVAETFVSFSGEVAREVLPHIQRFFDEVPNDTRAAASSLFMRGWYPDPNWGIDTFLGLGRGEMEIDDEALSDYFDEQAASIGENLVSIYPDRKTIFLQAFQAHAKGDYALSVAVLLAQADGICQELLSKSLYKKKWMKGGKCSHEVGKHLLENIATTDGFMEAVLSPFSERIPILRDGKERSQDTVELNRHLVLHGISVDYATRTNSCKSISLIHWVHWLVQEG